MRAKIVATLYYEQRNWAQIGLFCSAILDYFIDNNLPPLMAEKKQELERQLPEFTSFIKAALASGISIKDIRNLVDEFTDVRVFEPEGGTKSFKDIHKYLQEKLGDFQ